MLTPKCIVNQIQMKKKRNLKINPIVPIVAQNPEGIVESGENPEGFAKNKGSEVNEGKVGGTENSAESEEIVESPEVVVEIEVGSEPMYSDFTTSPEGSFKVTKLQEVLKEIETIEEGDFNRGFDQFEDPQPSMADAVKGHSKLSVFYLVCQGQEGHVMACRKKVESNERWPYFLYVSDEVAEKADNYKGKLQVGDLISVTSFTWSEKFRNLAAKRDEVSTNRKYWLNDNTQLLPRQADANELFSIIYDSRNCNFITGVVYWIKLKVQSQPSSFVYADIACCGLVASARINRRHLEEGLNVEELQLGQLVMVSVANIPRDSLVSNAYILPPSSPFKVGTERVAFVPEYFGAVSRVTRHSLEWPNLNNNGTPKVFPCSAELNDEQLKVVEHAVGAALQIEMEIETDKMIKARFEGRARRFEKDDCLLVFASRTKDEIALLTEVWEPEASVKAFTELCMLHFAMGTVREVNIEQSERERLELHVWVSLNNIQERKDGKVHGQALEFFQGGIAVLHPVPAAVVEDRLYCFRTNEPSAISKEDTPRGRIMAALLGRPTVHGARMTDEEFNDDADEWSEAEGDLHPVIRSLNGRQRQTVKLVLEGGLTHQQAPPGTGKTKVAAAIIKAVTDWSPDHRIAVMACANIPVTKLVQETEEVFGAQQLEEVGSMALFSGFAKSKYEEQIKDVERHTLVNKVDSEEFTESLSKEMMRKVVEYKVQCEKNPRMARERFVGKIFSAQTLPRVVFSTASMAADFLEDEGNLRDVALLLFDESTQAQWAIVTHLVARLPDLQAVLLTGDRHQLGVHLKQLPEVFHSGFGLESVIEQVEISPGANYTVLTKMYRSHPFITQLISYASYELHNEKLVPARSAEERARLTGSDFLLPVQECPVGLINAYNAFRGDVKSDSLTDDHQTEVTEYLVRALLLHFGSEFAKKIVVLCMYTLQAAEIANSLRGLNVRVHTVDAYQAQENDVTIIVTTRSRYAERGSGKSAGAMHFFEDNRRATVALSRARHATFLIGDLVTISAGPVWKRFIEKAITRTRVVRAEYVSALFGGTLMRSEVTACLIDTSTTNSVMDEEFIEDWAQKHGLNLDRIDAFRSNQSQSLRRPTFQFQSRQPVRQQQSSGPSTSSHGQHRAPEYPMPQPQRGRGRRGPDGQWMHYAGNPKRQRGGTRK